MAHEEISRVIGFWRDAGAENWFRKDAAFDEEFRRRFLPLHLAAASRRCDGWGETAEGSLALMILLDQFPRNAFRGTGHMYATDPLARYFARLALAAGQPGTIEREMRVFCFLPFSHSEDMDDQNLAMELNGAIGDPWLSHALQHCDIVRRFGRFPHRNLLLGRETTEEEALFLAEGGFAG